MSKKAIHHDRLRNTLSNCNICVSPRMGDLENEFIVKILNMIRVHDHFEDWDKDHTFGEFVYDGYHIQFFMVPDSRQEHETTLLVKFASESQLCIPS